MKLWLGVRAFLLFRERSYKSNVRTVCSEILDPKLVHLSIAFTQKVGAKMG